MMGNRLRGFKVLPVVTVALLAFSTAPHAMASGRVPGGAGQTSGKHAAGPQASLGPDAPAPTACTVYIKGVQWVDPDTGERWECQCRTVRDGRTLCKWELVEAKPNPSTWVNVNSGMYMDVDRVSRDNGARIHQWTYTGAGNQWWSMFNGLPQRAVSVNSGKCLGVAGGSTTRGAWIVQWDCNGHLDQSWAWRWTGERVGIWPVWELFNLNSRYCLGITSGSTQLGAYAIQWDCNGNLDQKWY